MTFASFTSGPSLGLQSHYTCWMPSRTCRYGVHAILFRESSKTFGQWTVRAIPNLRRCQRPSMNAGPTAINLTRSYRDICHQIIAPASTSLSSLKKAKSNLRSNGIYASKFHNLRSTNAAFSSSAHWTGGTGTCPIGDDDFGPPGGHDSPPLEMPRRSKTINNSPR